MSKLQDTRTVVFDKNLNRIIHSDPLFEALFGHIYTLTDLNTFLAQNGMLDEGFMKKLSMGGKEHHLCYQGIDLEDTFEFRFFLLADSWFVVNSAGGHDIHDQLSGLITEKSMLSFLGHEIKRISRNKEKSTAVLIDILHLKNINEMFGYLAGDYVVKAVADLLKENTRGSDMIGRFKGDKFLLVLNQTDAHGTMHYVKKFQASLQQIGFAFGGMNFDVELKYGATLCRADDTVDTVIERALKALAKAKENTLSDIEYLL